MNEIKVSIFASANRPALWWDFCRYLRYPEIEVVFAGPVAEIPKLPSGINFKYIKTENIKPAQCYEIARRACIGETVIWAADDCEFPNNIVLQAWSYWKKKNNEKLILSLQTKESGYGCKDGAIFPMKEHTFYSLMPETPLMAPLALMSRSFLNEIGGFDRRFCCGQYENFAIQMAYERGASVEIFGDKELYVDIDHLSKSIKIGESIDEDSFRERPFSKGYAIDRQVLENSWTTFNEKEAFLRLQAGERPFSLRKVSKVLIDKFEPYEDADILTKSQSNNIPERWS